MQITAVMNYKGGVGKTSVTANLAAELAWLGYRVLLLDKAEELLKDCKKADLQRIAKDLDIPIQKNEDVIRLKEKIIESTVGFKLRSQAIQGRGD